MAQLRLKILSDGEIEKVHKLSCEILSQTGMIIESEEIEQRLLKIGAKPGKMSHTVCFDEKMIEDALGTCPSSFTISSINGAKHLIGKDGRQYSSCIIDPKMNTGHSQSRKPVLKDCADNAKIIDYLECISMPYKMDLDYEDVRPSLSVVKSNEVLFQNFTKHVICAPMNGKDARTWMEMSEIMAPGKLVKTPIVSVLISPSSPLSLHEDCLQMLQCVLEYGVPIICLPCPMCGLTSPLSVIGTLIVLNAENLACYM